jgi:hypothetical protein
MKGAGAIVTIIAVVVIGGGAVVATRRRRRRRSCRRRRRRRKMRSSRIRITELPEFVRSPTVNVTVGRAEEGVG